MNDGTDIGVRSWPTLLGITGTIAVAGAMAVFGARTLLDGAVAPDHVAAHESMQRFLRLAFLLISVGAAWRIRSPLSIQWRWAVGVALAVLGCAVLGELAGELGRPGWIRDLGTGLGAADSFERRVFRLGAMAAYAVPMLALLAAGEEKPAIVGAGTRLSARIAVLLVRFEAWLFAIGAATLAGLLMAATFIHKEFTWASALGADTTVAACAAAAIRARWRNDRLAANGWLLVCAGLAVGLLMGIYSFGGPVPAPAFIGDYNALPRVLLRDGHVMLLAIGIAAISLAAIRQSGEGAS